MAGLSTAEFADAMKTYYLPPLNDQVYRAKVMLNRIEKNSEHVEGNFAYVPLITGRNPGVGSRKDTAGNGPKLPAAGRQSYDSATFKMAYHYGRGKVSGPVMRASKSNAGAFAKALETEMMGLSERLPEDLNRQVWSWGHGRAATLSGNQTTSTNITVNARAVFGAKIGDRVHFATIAAGATISPTTETTITDIAFYATATTHTVTLSQASGRTVTAASDAMYFGAPESSTDTENSSRAQEMFGLLAVIDSDNTVGADEGLGGAATVAANAGEFIDGTAHFGSIDRATVPIWRGQKLQNPAGAGTLRATTVPSMEEAFLTYIVNGGKEQSLEMYCSPGIFATIGLLHLGDRRFNDYKETLEGGFVAIKWNGRPIFMDRDCLENSLFFFDMSTIMLLTQTDYELMDEDGKVLNRIPDRDAYEFTLYRDCQIASRKCKPNTWLGDLTSTMNINWKN